MMAPLTWNTEDQQGRVVVAVRGRLDTAAAPTLRTALLEQLAGQPEALLVDLSAMAVGDRTSLSLFTSVADQAAMWPGTPVMLCAPTAATGALLAGRRYAGLRVHGSVAGAHRAVTAGPVAPPAVADDLLPLSGAARHARNLATEACVRWSLPHLTGPAAVVTSELVTNAVEHAGTMMNLRLTRRANGLHIAVADGSTATPELAPLPAVSPSGGRGLHLVAGLAANWGFLRTATGKVVWAILATGEGATPADR
jgi:anti-anti-sigma regulatory factor